MATRLLRRLWEWALANAERVFFVGRITSTLWFLSSVLLGLMVVARIGDTGSRVRVFAFSTFCFLLTIATFSVAHAEARNRVRRPPPR